ncbi:MAG: cation diffusion facilitator family transporter [Alphaproteobacteria bacterium]|nr:cation diffusion facilitator family transporter [Alphaproteobacteria bacterium]
MQQEEIRAVDPIDTVAANPLARRATFAAVGVACFLLALKIAAWIVTGSVSILASLLDSLLDAFASIVTLIAVRRATAPPTSEFRYGHGKAEPLAALAQSAFIAGSAVLLIIQAGERFINPRPVAETTIGIAVMVVSILATLGLVAYQGYVIRKSDSVAIKADSLHYKGDLLANIGVIAALLLVAHGGFELADPIFGLAIALFILWNARGVATEALGMLMDRELPDAERARIAEVARSYKEVIKMQDLRTRRSGPYRFIQMHIEVDGQMSLTRAHAIADAIELQIMEEFPGSEVIVHQDPEGFHEHGHYRDYGHDAPKKAAISAKRTGHV